MKKALRSGWLAGAAALGAVLASACCWVPLVAIVVGVSAAGLSAVLWSARPWLLAGSAVLLVLGLRMSYRRTATCEPGSDCAAPAPARHRIHRAGVWIAAAALVLAAFLPNALGLLPGGPSSAAASSERIELPIEGMTCAGCERAVESSLRKVEGVLSVEASAAEAYAIVTTASAARPPRAALIAAVATAGYRVPEPAAPAGHWEGTLGEGEAAVALVADIAPADGGRWIGEIDFPSQGVENLSPEIVVEGRAVRFVVPLPDRVMLAGELSAGGDSLAGRFKQADTDLAFVLVRSGEAVLSKELLAMETPAGEAAVTVLSDDWTELKQEFNGAAGRTRLLLLLSPT
jgi:copper chaperone CopZ